MIEKESIQRFKETMQVSLTVRTHHSTPCCENADYRKKHHYISPLQLHIDKEVYEDQSCDYKSKIGSLQGPQIQDPDDCERT